MPIQVDAPASLLLGLAPVGGSLAAVSLALQHPPVQLTAQPAPALLVSGACAPLAYAAAARYGQPAAELQVELAIPSLMGLAAEEMLGLAVARALAALQAAPTEAVTLAQALGWGPDRAPEVWGFDRGGLLLTDVRAPLGTPPLGRRPLSHPDARAWVLVLYLPKPPDETPDDLEATRRAALLAAAERLPAAAGRLVTEAVWPAAERDDFPAFAQAAQALLDANLEALRAAGAGPALLPEAQMVLERLRAGGAALCGPCLTGLGVFGLVQGAQRSVELRRPIMARLGHEAGTLLTTITHNAGARHGPALDFGP